MRLPRELISLEQLDGLGWAQADGYWLSSSWQEFIGGEVEGEGGLVNYK